MAALQASQCTWPSEGQSLMLRQVSTVSQPSLYSCLCKANGTLGHLSRLQLTVQPVPSLLATVCSWGRSNLKAPCKHELSFWTVLYIWIEQPQRCVYSPLAILWSWRLFLCNVSGLCVVACTTCSITSWQSSANSTNKYQFLLYLKTGYKMWAACKSFHTS